jgi:hypothetical protein
MVSQKTKERVAYWAAKLECPVDADANYENTYVRLTPFQSLKGGKLTISSGVIEI